MLNKSGPSTEPCGTPLGITAHSLIFTNYWYKYNQRLTKLSLPESIEHGDGATSHNDADTEEPGDVDKPVREETAPGFIAMETLQHRWSRKQNQNIYLRSRKYCSW